MVVRVIDSGANGNAFAFNAITGGQNNGDIAGYLRDNLTRLQNSMSSHGAAFIKKSWETFDKFNNSEIVNKAKSLMFKLDNFNNDNVVRTTTFSNYKELNRTTQYWNMIQPDMRRKYDRMSCSGYGDTVFFKDKVTDYYNNVEYNRVMDGVLQHDEDEGMMFSSHHSVVLEGGDEELATVEQFAILDSWEVVSAALAEGIDISKVEE